jgi:hypothetical protein
MILGLAMATLSVTSCASSPDTAQTDGSVGQVDARIVLSSSPSVAINTIGYQLFQGTATTPVASGNFDVSGTTATNTFARTIPNVAAGTGYYVVLHAVSADNSIQCDGRSSYPPGLTVAARTPTAVSIHMTCNTPRARGGAIAVSGEINLCPGIDSIYADDVVTTGTVSTAQLHGAASDYDAFPGALSYSWSEGGTVFSALDSPVYTCASGGDHTLTLTVSDTDTACTPTNAPDITDSITVTCPGPVVPVCGNGVLEAGEACDLGAANSDTAPTCPAPNGCSNSCQAVPCQEPQVVTPETILAAQGAGCLSCAQLNCSDYLVGSGVSCQEITGTAVAGPAVGVTRSALCIEELQCVTTQNCATSSVSPCYCGTDAACTVDATINGLCKTAAQRSLESTDPVYIALHFGDVSLGGGVANQLATCLISSFCNTAGVCGPNL